MCIIWANNLIANIIIWAAGIDGSLLIKEPEKKVVSKLNTWEYLEPSLLTLLRVCSYSIWQHFVVQASVQQLTHTPWLSCEIWGQSDKRAATTRHLMHTSKTIFSTVAEVCSPVMAPLEAREGNFSVAGSREYISWVPPPDILRKGKGQQSDY